MSSIEIDFLQILEKFGFGAVAIYMMFRIENKIDELKDSIQDLCKKMG